MCCFLNLCCDILVSLNRQINLDGDIKSSITHGKPWLAAITMQTWRINTDKDVAVVRAREKKQLKPQWRRKVTAAAFSSPAETIYDPCRLKRSFMVVAMPPPAPDRYLPAVSLQNDECLTCRGREPNPPHPQHQRWIQIQNQMLFIKQLQAAATQRALHIRNKVCIKQNKKQDFESWKNDTEVGY